MLKNGGVINEVSEDAGGSERLLIEPNQIWNKTLNPTRTPFKTGASKVH